MVHEEREGDLSNLFTLLNGIPRALDFVVSEFESHIKEYGERGREGGKERGRKGWRGTLATTLPSLQA